jgi:hypothetical protein
VRYCLTPAACGGDDRIEELEAALTRLGRAVLLFHRGGRWTGQNRNEWVMLTGEEDATTKVLCDLARKLLQHTQGDAP